MLNESTHSINIYCKALNVDGNMTVVTMFNYKFSKWTFFTFLKHIVAGSTLTWSDPSAYVAN